MDRQTSQAIGSWIESDPLGVGGPRVPACPMSVLYADQRALASGMAKKKVLDKLLQTFKSMPGCSDAFVGAALQPHAASLGWPEVALHASAADHQLQLQVHNHPTEPPTPPTREAQAKGTKRRRLRIDTRPSHKDRAS